LALTLQRQIRDTPTPVHVHRPSLPWPGAIRSCSALAKTPADRFQSGEEFRDALAARRVRCPPLITPDVAVAEGQHSLAHVPGPTDTIDLGGSGHELKTANGAAPLAAAGCAGASHRRRWSLQQSSGVAIGYAASARGDGSFDGLTRETI
jgi:hypothetical protein